MYVAEEVSMLNSKTGMHMYVVITEVLYPAPIMYPLNLTHAIHVLTTKAPHNPNTVAM